MPGKQLLATILRLMQRLVANRKLITIVIVVIAVVGMIITGVSILKKAQDLILNTDLSHINAQEHNDIVRLDIFRHCFFMFMVISAGVLGVMLCYHKKLEYIYLVAALCLGTAYMFSITPMSVPDEPYHYQSAYVISSHLLPTADPLQGSWQHFDYDMLNGHHNVPTAYLRLMDEGVYATREQMDLIKVPGSYGTIYPLMSLPQALGIAIARIIGLSFFGVFYIGRFFNLLFYSLCVFFSIKRLKTFQLPLFIIGLLPMSLHQAASFSYDGFINGVSLLFIAYAISYIYENDIFHWRDYAILLILGLLLVPAKLIYLPIIFLVFVAARKWYRTIKGRAWLLAASIALASVVVAYIVSFLIYDIGAADTFTTGGSDLNWEGEHNYTLSFVLRNPVETIIIFLRTFFRSAHIYVYGVFGLYLSGHTLVLPRVLIYIIIGISIASCYYGKRDEWQPTIGERAVYFSISAMVVGLSMAAMFIGWTSDTSDVVIGVQGRYFTPLLPLAALIIRISRFQIPYKSYRNILIVGILLIQGFIIKYILDFTINQLH